MIFSSAVAYLIMYYYKKEAIESKRYNEYLLFKEIVIRCSIAVGIELVFNVISVKIQEYLYNIPVIGVWRRKWKTVIVVHVIQVSLVVLYFSPYVNSFLLRDSSKNLHSICFGIFQKSLGDVIDGNR